MAEQAHMSGLLLIFTSKKVKSNHRQLTGYRNLFALDERLGEASFFHPKRPSKLGIIQQTFSYGAGLWPRRFPHFI